jgi:hypothetical protein
MEHYSSYIVQQLKREKIRLQSFDMWPLAHVIEPWKMAREGFFFTGDGTKVQCVFCRGVTNNFIYRNASWLHQQYAFQHCRFYQNQAVGNVPLIGDELRPDLTRVRFDVCQLPNCLIHNFNDEGFVDDYDSTPE